MRLLWNLLGHQGESVQLLPLLTVFCDDSMQISQYGEYAVTGLFTLEFLIKITALGGFLHQVCLRAS